MYRQSKSVGALQWSGLANERGEKKGGDTIKNTNRTEQRSFCEHATDRRCGKNVELSMTLSHRKLLYQHETKKNTVKTSENHDLCYFCCDFGSLLELFGHLKLVLVVPGPEQGQETAKRRP